MLSPIKVKISSERRADARGEKQRVNNHQNSVFHVLVLWKK
jgi:hypothetical protein